MSTTTMMAPTAEINRAYSTEEAPQSDRRDLTTFIPRSEVRGHRKVLVTSRRPHPRRALAVVGALS